ncbi:MAG: YitT family protein [Clostridiales bacterium]|nr:YitT family protein [Candidatus Crickella equi]
MSKFQELDKRIESNDTSRLIKQLVYISVGNFIFALTMNYLVTPFLIYCSGAMGVAQLIELLFKTIGIPAIPKIGWLGIIYWGMSIPAFLYGMKVLGAKFLVKTVYSITSLSLFLSIIPVADTPIIENKIMGCIAAAVVGGFALGIGTFSSGAGAGASDCIGMVLAQKKPGFSIGLINMIVNVCVYSICAFIYGIEGAAFSIFYAAILAWAMDKGHLQNHYIEITVYSKVPVMATELANKINRGVTSWYGEGAYTKTQTNIVKTIVTKKESDGVVAAIYELDPQAFISVQEIGKVHGIFDKRLSK